MKKTLLSLTASTLLVSGLSASNTITSASINLTDYNATKIVFDTLDTATLDKVKQDIIDGNITIENNTTDDNLSVTYDRNTSNIIYLHVTTPAGIKVVRGNSYNHLTLNVVDTTWDDANTTDDFNLTKTIGTLAVQDNKWNLITMPTGVSTNAKEMIKSGKATMIWGWEQNSSNKYNWAAYPERMESGRGYWVRTRVAANTEASLGNVIASDYNTSVKSDISGITADINTSNFADVVSNMPIKEEWVLLGNGGADANITATSVAKDNNSTHYFFEDLLNKTHNCYFVSIYHWNATSDTWVNDTEGGSTPTGITIPANAGVWVKQRLCDK